jgi:hypothetical protein
MLAMRYAKSNSMRARLRVCVAAALTATGVALAAGGAGTAEESAAYAIEVNDVTAKVGDHAVMHATLRVRDGYRILQSYKNRVIKLSAEDDGVTFDQETVPAAIEEGALLFAVGLRVTKPGKHPVNGLFRVGYLHGTDEIAMVSLRLIASVTGTE